MQNLTSAWGKTLKYFQNNHTSDYTLWIINLNFVKFDKRKKILYLSVSNPFTRDNIIEKFKEKIEQVFSSYIEIEQILLDIIISEEKNLLEEATFNKIEHEKVKEIPKQKNYRRSELPDLNPKYTFERFVVGSNNKLPYAAAELISQNPGKDYNPFFLYGGSGLGKTHLMQAIGNYVIKQRSDLSVVYVTAEQYLNDYIQAMRLRKFDSFRKKYREIDVLLLDDIQFLEGKEKIQEELFNNFNKIYQGNRQIVFTCDKPPKELKQIEDRLITRFSWGLVTDIKQPDIETRKAIIISKIEEVSISKFIETKIIDYLSENITSNIRDIEASINKIKLLVLSDEPITLELLENNLSDILTPIRARKRLLTCEVIQREVANYFKISYSDMKSKKRTKDVSFPRHMAMFFSKDLLNLSFSEIGNEFGGRDHSTVVASYKKVKIEIKKNPSIRNDYEELLKVFSNF